MSQSSFQTLIDDLTVLLLSGDWGTGACLVEVRTRLESALTYLESIHENDLIALATPALEKLRLQENTGSVSVQLAEALTAEVEQLVRDWYDAAKRLGSASVTPEAASALKLAEFADLALVHEFIANTRLAVDDLQSLVEQLQHGSPQAAATIRRLIHSLKGEAGMLGLEALTQLLHLTESYLEAPAADWDRAKLIQRVADWILDAVAEYECGVQPVVPRQLLESLAFEDPTPRVSLIPDAPLPRPEVGSSINISNETPQGFGDALGTQWDDQELELVTEFLHECNEATGIIDQTLLEIEQKGTDEEGINKLFRAFHSLKGVASFLRLTQIVELAHTTETMLDRVRSGKITATTGVVDLVFDATTALRALANAVQHAVDTATPLEAVVRTESLIGSIREATAGNATEGGMLSATEGGRIGEILVANGVVTQSQLECALQQQQQSGRKLGEELVAEGIVPAKAVVQALRTQKNPAAAHAKAKEIVKVDLERVDNLVETIGELVIVESMVTNSPEIRALPVHLRNYLDQFAKITRELQGLGMRMRMVPVRAEFQKMARMVRDLTHRSNKKVSIELRGEQTEMDRSMVEQIADPLVHLIRNAVDHGVELPDERIAQGKPEVATIVLSAFHEGGSIIVEISDDGRGIDRERVIAKAVAQGLIIAGASLTDNLVYDLLFTPGFSTAAQVTEISGRGVGMDVVKRNIESIRGRILTHSAKGRGTTFRLVLPLTLAIIDGMVIRSGNERFIVPTLNIIESLQPTRDMLFSIAHTSEHILVRGQSLPLLRLGDILGVTNQERDPTKALVIIVESMRSKVAFVVDEVVMKHQVVIKTLGSELGVNSLFAGAAILSNGRVGLIVNVESLIQSALAKVGPAIADVA